MLADLAERCRLPGLATIVEIGPGLGALTAHLLPIAPRLILIEKDTRFAAALSARFRTRPGVEIIEGDAASFDYAPVLGGAGTAVVVGNLPYNAASPIYFGLLDQRRHFARLVLMFQREVAERLVATPGSKAYGAPSVATAMFFSARIVHRLAPAAFVPRPKVHSAVVELVPRPTPLCPLEDEAAFLRFVRTLFRFRRKTLANALRAGALSPASASPSAAAAVADPDPRVRAEQLDASALWRLYLACGGR